MHYFTSFSLSLNCSTQNEPHNPISHFDKDNDIIWKTHDNMLVFSILRKYNIIHKLK